MKSWITDATLEHKTLMAIGAFIFVIVGNFLIPGSWFLQLKVEPPNNQKSISANVGKDVVFQLCRSGIAVPVVEAEGRRTTTSLTGVGGSQYSFPFDIEGERCIPLIHRAFDPKTGEARIPQEPGTYLVTTNVFFSFLGGRDTTYEFEFEYK